MTHSATKLDAIFSQYEAIAEEHHHNANVRAEIIVELEAKPSKTNDERKEITQQKADWRYFNKLYRATCQKMDAVRKLIALEETHPTSAFLWNFLS